MADQIHDLGNGFWNIQGTFKIGGLVDIGTQCSLVQLASGKFIFLDSYCLKDDVRAEVMALTNNGQDVEAVLNLHPFHTVFCEEMASDFPNAKFYGSERHHKKIPSVNWESDYVESEAVTSRYPELEFSLPRGIHYIHPNEHIHASSLLAYHPVSKSLHVDDTFVTPPDFLPSIITGFLPEIALHPTTKKALLEEPNAGEAYCDWANEVANQWSETRNFCAAHSGVLTLENGEFKQAVDKAVAKFRKKLEG